MAGWTDEWADDARVEYLAALRHYLTIDARLAADFADRVDRSVESILVNRAVASAYLAGTRRKLLGRFPFAIVYRVRSSECVVEIVALVHLRRRPGYWLGRVQSG
ncbi:MAG: type II toxin-antitoxin system RelE/ParE family toxin [Phycisphaerales bacterium JB063]